jgi:Protein of unknown function (DUF2927)
MRLQHLLQNVVRYSLYCGISSTILLGGGALSSYAQSANSQLVELTAADPSTQIDVRLQPSTAATAPHYGLVGDRVQVLNQTTGRDGFVWYYVRFSQAPQAEGWVRGDFVQPVGVSSQTTIARGGYPDDQAPQPQEQRIARSQEPQRSQSVVSAPTPLSSQPTASQGRTDLPVVSVQRNFGEAVPPRTVYTTQSSSVSAARESMQTAQAPRSSDATSVPIRVIGPDPSTYSYRTPEPRSAPTPVAMGGPGPTSYVAPATRFTAEQISYFLEVALGSEFGSSGGVLRKWSGPVTIRVHGRPTGQDQATLQSVVAEINQLAEGIELQLTQGAAPGRTGIDIHFAPESQFSQLESNYQPRNMGFFWTWWDNSNVLNRANILISTDGVSQAERSHLIREELTQSLGLMQDSRRYEDSIFYQGWTETTRYSTADQAAIALLYRPEIRAGMTRDQVVRVVQTLGGARRLTALPGWTQIRNLAFNLNQQTEAQPSMWDGFQSPYQLLPTRRNPQG